MTVYDLIGTQNRRRTFTPPVVVPPPAGLTPGTTVLHPTTNVGWPASTDTTYALARAGGGATVDGLPLAAIGQASFDSTDFECYQVLLEFDTHVDSGTLSSATLTLAVTGGVPPQAFTIQAFHRAYGPSVEAADFVAGATLAGLTVAATTPGVIGTVAMTNVGTVLKDGVNVSGMTRLLLASDRQRNNLAPVETLDEYVLLNSLAACTLTCVVT